MNEAFSPFNFDRKCLKTETSIAVHQKGNQPMYARQRFSGVVAGHGIGGSADESASGNVETRGDFS